MEEGDTLTPGGYSGSPNPDGESPLRQSGTGRRLGHHYGERVHLLDDPYLLSLLSRIGSPESDGELLPSLVRSAYKRLFQDILNAHFPTTNERVPTRMAQADPRGVYEGPRFQDDVGLVICSIVRGGVVPGQVCYEAACEVLPSQNVRLDFFCASRTVDANGVVTGVRLDGTKIGGSIKNSILVIPDPMCATGGTVATVLEAYEAYDAKQARALVSANLIVTPEAVQTITKRCPQAHLWGARLDRGASPEHVLGTVPGTYAEEESGLNQNQYILPGAGGIGEALTNVDV